MPRWRCPLPPDRVDFCSAVRCQCNVNALHKSMEVHAQFPFKRQAGEERIHHVRFAAPDTAPEIQPQSQVRRCRRLSKRLRRAHTVSSRIALWVSRRTQVIEFSDNRCLRGVRQ